MARIDDRVPDLVPHLSRGKHRNPRKGACFMELASFLAGERWSDHPACTHPLLAALARHVNDQTSDAARPRLAALIPSVIGLTSDDPCLDPRIALRAATTALPVSADERQRTLAVGILSCERVLDELGGRRPGTIGEQSRTALDQVPLAAAWAREYAGHVSGAPKAFYRRAAPCIVRYAVDGIAQACISNPDELLRDLLTRTIDDCARWIDRPADIPVGAEDTLWFEGGQWAAACRLAGAAGPSR